MNSLESQPNDKISFALCTVIKFVLTTQIGYFVFSVIEAVGVVGGAFCDPPPLNF